MNTLFYGFWPLLLRGMMSWRPYWFLYYVRLLEIPLGLFAYGLGFAAMAIVVNAESYAAFVLPGLLVWTLWLAVVIESTYMLFGKVYNHKIWESVLATPTRLPALLLAEQTLSVIKAVPLILLSLPIALYYQAVPNLSGYLLAIPIMATFVLTATAFGNWLTSIAKHEYQFDYIWPIFVLPMFLFSGMMFPITLLPEPLQALSLVFPMTHVLESIRPLILGQPSINILPHVLCLIAMWVGFTMLAYKNFNKRLQTV
jgi:lipooligosaccharide transport system permease protein